MAEEKGLTTVRFRGVYCYGRQSTAPFVLEDGQRTGDRNWFVRDEDELRFPQRLTRLHTKLSHYKYGLWDDKGNVATREVKILTRVAVTITFLLLTNEGVTTLSGYSDRVYTHFHMRNA